MQTRNGKTYLDAAPDGNENIYPYMWLKSHKSQRKKQIVSLAAYENGVTHMHLQLFECVCGSPTRIHQCVCVSGWELAFLCFSKRSTMGHEGFSHANGECQKTLSINGIINKCPADRFCLSIFFWIFMEPIFCTLISLLFWLSSQLYFFTKYY